MQFRKELQPTLILFAIFLLYSGINCFNEATFGFVDTEKSNCMHYKQLAIATGFEEDRIVLISCKIRTPMNNQFLALIRLRGTEIYCKSAAQTTIGEGQDMMIISGYAEDEDCHKILVKKDLTRNEM